MGVAEWFWFFCQQKRFPKCSSRLCLRRPVPLLIVRELGLTCAGGLLIASGWVLGHLPGQGWMSAGRTGRCPQKSLPPHQWLCTSWQPSRARSSGGERAGQRMDTDERPTRSPGSLSDFSFSPLWRTVCGFRWSGLVPQLSPELHQWTDLPIFCHCAQGLWYGALCMFLFVCLFMFSDSFQLLGPFPIVSPFHSQLYPLLLWVQAEQSPLKDTESGCQKWAVEYSPDTRGRKGTSWPEAKGGGG